jgi:hypothetical protein
MMAGATATEVKEERKAPQGVIIPPAEIRGISSLAPLFNAQINLRRNHRKNSKLRCSK